MQRARGRWPAQLRAMQGLRVFLISLLISCSFILANPAISPATANPASPTPTAQQQQGSPVKLEDKTIFFIQSRIGSFSPEFRAGVISKRIDIFAKDLTANIDSLSILDNDDTSTYDIRAGNIVLMSVAKVDAIAAGTAEKALAETNLRLIKQSVAEFRKAYSVQSILRGILLTVLTTILLVTIFLLLTRSSPIIQKRLRAWRGTRVQALRVMGSELLSAQRVVDFICEFVKFIQLTLLIFLAYIYTNLILSYFPWTKSISRALFGYVLSALTAAGEGVAAYMPNLFFLGVIILLTIYILKVIRFIFAEIGHGNITISGFDPEWAQPTFKLVQILILAFAATVCFPYLPGSATPAFQGVSIFLGVLVSLGSSGAVANTVAGVILTYTRAFRIGDRVQITDTTGDIVGKTLFVTRVRTIKNVVITIPNATVLNSHVINFSAAESDNESSPLILHTTITLGYDLPWRKVHEVLIRSALTTQYILPEPAPFVLQKSLDDFYVSYELNACTKQPGRMALIYSELHQNIQDNCIMAGIEILSPHYRAVRDGNPITIPEAEGAE